MYTALYDGSVQNDYCLRFLSHIIICYTHIGATVILDLTKVTYRRTKLKWLVTYLFNGFTEKLKQSYNLCICSECIQWSNRQCRPLVWSAAAENFDEICKVKARLHAVLQITSAQHYASIHFILPQLKLNRTGGSTHWRRKHKTCSIRSTESDQLTIKIRCGHNKLSEATRSTFARLCSSAGVS